MLVVRLLGIVMVCCFSFGFFLGLLWFGGFFFFLVICLLGGLVVFWLAWFVFVCVGSFFVLFFGYFVYWLVCVCLWGICGFF